MKKLWIKDESECEWCYGEEEYEVMNLLSNGEVEYYMQQCECTLEENSPKVKITIIK